MIELPAVIEAALSFAWRHWKAITAVTALISILVYIGILKGDVSHWHKLANQFAEQNKLLEASYTAAQQTARANNIEAVRKAETDGAKISEDKQHDLETKLADARALADAYLVRLRAGTATVDKGTAGQAVVSAASGTPGDLVGTGGVSVMDAGDVQVCTANSVKALGWQQFYGDVRARYNALTGVDIIPK